MNIIRAIVSDRLQVQVGEQRSIEMSFGFESMFRDQLENRHGGQWARVAGKFAEGFTVAMSERELLKFAFDKFLSVNEI